MNKKELTKKIICYLTGILGEKIEGKKKIMKLMFLIEHYNFDTDKLTSKGFLNNSFHIYRYGVFSWGIMDCVNELIDKKQITDTFPLECKEVVELDEETKDIVDKTIRKFGDEEGYKLEVQTLRMLGIEPHQKKEFFGKEIKGLIKG